MPPMPTDTERAAFEAWAKTADMPLGMYSASDYADAATQLSWDAWQAASAARNRDLHDAACTAYGWLWLAISSDERIHQARQALKSHLSRDDLRQGIQAAMAAGGTVDAASLEANLYRGMIA